MKGTDKFLIGIVAGIVVLIVAAFAIVLTRPAPTYKSDDAAEGVAFNYLFALDKNDYPRAYSYLSRTLKGRPSSAENMARDIERRCYGCNRGGDSSSWSVESSRTVGSNTVVTVRTTSYSTGIFGSTYDSTLEMRLTREEGVWKIVSLDSYWPYCWNTGGGCGN